MRTLLLFFLLLMVTNLPASPARALDGYLAIYATWNGLTGHAGFAVDTYQIRVKEVNGKTIEDTVATGKLLYFDLWPKVDNFALYSGANVEAKYFQLPQSTSEKPITVASLLAKGIPHREGYPVDGLIRIPAGPHTTLKLTRMLEQQIAQNKPFNTLHHNCADFAEAAATYLLKTDLDAEEDIFFFRSTTPNRLYAAVAAQPGVRIIRDAGGKVAGSFVSERIVR